MTIESENVNMELSKKIGEFKHSTNTDPDLIISYETIQLPSKGLFYVNKIKELDVEYMTSKDEDLLTTPSLIENGTVLNLFLKRKIKTQGIDPDDLLNGDRNAILLYLRTSSYGSEYTVMVTDPRNGSQFTEVVDLLKLKYKEIVEKPNDDLTYEIKIPKRDKLVKFKLLTAKEDMYCFKEAEARKELYNQPYSEYNTLKLKTSIVSIDGNKDRFYIDKFVDAMPSLDALTIRKEIDRLSPDVDMSYTFTAPDGYKFKSKLLIGIDFFFPNP